MTPLCFNTNSAERKSCPPLGRDEGRVVCVVWEPNLQSTGKVGPRLPAWQGEMAPRMTQCMAQLPEYGACNCRSSSSH